ncbi:MAG: heparan-alpha-glucosaminide N-acetyltransferase domain-containing protein, partial [Thermoproteota archaeon]|nr:heparan-alpha-glucosaminide N-acetyltransferase domain-containing protein [Thermoproteota archaeon]
MESVTAQPEKRYRIQSIDLLRGLVMIIMALDHTRDYFHWSSQVYDPLDLSQTSVAIFLTRWITHFCAPVFMFLAGTSAYFVGQRKTKKQLSFFLFTRGLWLMLLELTVVYFGWSFNMHFPVSALITIWALGAAMVALSVLIYLPYKVILAFGILIVACHNLFDNFHVAGNSLQAFIWDELHDPRALNFYGHTVITGYPILPWIGIITLGYCFGKLYGKEFNVTKRKKWLLLIGCSAVLLYIILRAGNFYGDQQLWTSQHSNFFTFLS